MTYNDYLNSSHWKSLREKFISENPNCYICGDKERLHVHHITYKNKDGSVLGKESGKELVTLCNKCHKTWHNIHGLEKHGYYQSYNRAKKIYDLGLSREDAIKLSYKAQFVDFLFRTKKDILKGRKSPSKAKSITKRWTIRSRLRAIGVEKTKGPER